MTASAQLLIDRNQGRFCHDAARRLRQSVDLAPQDTVIIDFGQVQQITTAALAELVLLRRKLLAAGCDLRVANMSGQVADLYRLCRLDGVLPAAS